MLNGPLLVTDRLILRPPSAEDFDDFAAMCTEADAKEHIGGVSERSVGKWVGRLGAVNSGPTQMPAPFQAYPVDAWRQTADQWRAKRKEIQL